MQCRKQFANTTFFGSAADLSPQEVCALEDSHLQCKWTFRHLLSSLERCPDLCPPSSLTLSEQQLCLMQRICVISNSYDFKMISCAIMCFYGYRGEGSPFYQQKQSCHLLDAIPGCFWRTRPHTPRWHAARLLWRSLCLQQRVHPALKREDNIHDTHFV